MILEVRVAAARHREQEALALMEQAEAQRVEREAIYRQWQAERAAIIANDLEKRREEEERWRQENEIELAKQLEQQRRREIKRQREELAEAERMAQIAQIRRAFLDQKKREREPPSLQNLVEAFGGYDLISREGWAEFDAKMAHWKARKRDGADYYEDHELRRRGLL
jgi:hypothetical protein